MQIKVGVMTFVFLNAVCNSDFANANNAPWECMGPAASCVSGKKSPPFLKHRNYEASRSESKSYSNNNRPNNPEIDQSPKGSTSSGSYGMASYYWQHQRLASGGVFNPNALTAAHKTLPFGTKVLVTNKNNGRSVTVVINDRGPFIKGRIIDLSKAAAAEIGMIGSGVAPVTVAIMD